MMTLYLRVKGRVQGVGYRWWVNRKALEIGGISGYIYNDDDGDVLVCLSGESGKVEEMHNALYQGTLFSRVDAIEKLSGGELLFPPVQNGVFKRL